GVLYGEGGELLVRPRRTVMRLAGEFGQLFLRRIIFRSFHGYLRRCGFRFATDAAGWCGGLFRFVFVLWRLSEKIKRAAHRLKECKRQSNERTRTGNTKSKPILCPDNSTAG